MSDLYLPSYEQGFAQSAGESADPNLWDGLSGLWLSSLGPTGLTLRNVSGRSNHGVLTNMDPATVWVAGRYGYGLSFVSTRTVKIPSSFLTDNFGSGYSGDFTACVLVKPTANTTYNCLIDTASRHLTIMYAVGGNQGYYGIGGSAGSSPIELAINQRHVVIMRRRGVTAQNANIFVNGIKVHTFPSAATTFTEELEIGGNPSGGGSTHSKVVAGVSVYNRALTGSEIAKTTTDFIGLVRRRAMVFPGAVAAPPAGNRRRRLILLGA